MSETYGSFATVYDSFMDDVPYADWCGFIVSKLKENGVNTGIVLDLGCGTGRLTRLLAREGFDMIGIDNSPEMLDEAQKHETGVSAADGKKGGQKKKILYLCQDMREFELYGTVSAVVSACDCVNYILDKRELKKVFSLVNNYLESRGTFIFDFHTEHYYRDVLSNNTFAENRENAAFIWNNYYDSRSHLNEYDLTIFAKCPEESARSEKSSATDKRDNIFERYTETHIQRAYSAEEIKGLLIRAGMEPVAMYDSYTGKPVNSKTERITVVALEKFQKGKHYE